MTPKEPLDPGKVDLFRWADQLPPALWDDLAGRDPQEAAFATGAHWDGQQFRLPLFTREFAVDPNARRVWLTEDPDYRASFQSALVLVNALGKSLAVPPSGRMVTPHELPGGAQFFQGPHAINRAPLEKAFGQDPRELLEAARGMGGEPAEGGDAGVKIPALPMVPLHVLIWAGDEEFGPRAVVGLDAHAHHHLPLDVIWALTNLLALRLTWGRDD